MQLEFKRNLGVKDRMLLIAIGSILVILVTMHVVTGWMSSSALFIAGLTIFEAVIGY